MVLDNSFQSYSVIVLTNKIKIKINSNKSIVLAFKSLTSK